MSRRPKSAVSKNAIGGLHIQLDDNGHIVPTLEVMRQIEREVPNESDAHKYRLAQAQTMIDAVAATQVKAPKSAKRGTR